MKVLLAYATYSSGTDLASQLVTSLLTAHNISVERKNIREVSPENLSDYDLVIFASPSWRTRKGDGYPHEFFLDFMEKPQAENCRGRKFAIFGLGDRVYTHFCGAVDHLESFVQELGGVLLVPSLRIDGFYFNQEENEQKLREWTSQLLALLPSPAAV
ncbi:MAG TPA: flavodoxin domain-containing protein [Patescibacteria group bacterium]|nr:flavodoxin domain-containing protein [Patescibacteria group bacterium]